MSDEESNQASAEGQEDGEEKAEFSAKKLILFVVVPLVLLAGVGGGLYFSGMLDSFIGKGDEQHEGEEGGAAHAHAAPVSTSGPAAFVEIPTMIVNLSEDDGTPRFLRLTVQLELKNPADAPRIEGVMPRVIDQFQTYLRELRVRDLRGSAGIYRLQMELLWRVNQAASPIEVKDVLFQEILIQ
ncbi:MAG: flagellar basal body-associated FliL family protein [Alphaproteobacteria bacterium]